MSSMNFTFPLTSTACVTVTNSNFHEHIANLEEKCVLYCCEMLSKGFTEALLFQTAVSACHQQLKVTIICKEKLASLPPSVHGMPCPGPSFMQHLNIMYLSTSDDLMNYLSRIHLTGCPDVLILTHLEELLGSSRDDVNEYYLSKMCALVADTSAYIRKQSSNGLVMVSTDGHLGIDNCRKFFDSIYKVIQVDDSPAFEITNETLDNACPRFKMSAFMKSDEICLGDISVLCEQNVPSL